jgi:succinyl-diaminopimelate desuccinylase
MHWRDFFPGTFQINRPFGGKHMIDPVKYTQDLVRFDTTNPPGREKECVEFAARTLEGAGYKIDRQIFQGDRMNVVARLDGSDSDLLPLVMTGHLDTVPLGQAPWKYDPFGGDIIDGKLYGRGSSDMKAGVAAMLVAALRMACRESGRPRRALHLILTSGEETGCAGALHLVDHSKNLLGRASGLIVGEPTANAVSIAHKGALFMSAKLEGVTAHSSQPELGDNAIYKAARAISKVEEYGFNRPPHPLLGSPTINVGMINGGMNVNSVPDRAEFTIDIRTNASVSHEEFFDDLKNYLGEGVALSTFTNMPAISTLPDDPLTLLAMETCRSVLGKGAVKAPSGLPFFTDASALQPELKCPTLILGPGEPPTMHQTDEYCVVQRIGEAAEIYHRIAEEWCA